MHSFERQKREPTPTKYKRLCFPRCREHFETILGTRNAEFWVLGISPLSIGAIGALVNFAVAFGVSKVTAEPPVEIQELVESVRYPRGAGSAQDH